MVAVEGIGCSFPFRIDADVYREAFRTVARGLYHNRSGIALDGALHRVHPPGAAQPQAHARLRRQAPLHDRALHRVGLRGRGRQGPHGQREGARSSPAAGTRTPAIGTATTRTCASPRSCSSPTRWRRATSRDGELNIPESGNGVPDILDEAAWLPRFCYRLRHELMDKGYGTGGVGLRMAGDAFGGDEKTLPGGKKVGQGSWEDVNRTWVASGRGSLVHLPLRRRGRPPGLLPAARRAPRTPKGVDWAEGGGRGLRLGPEATRGPATRRRARPCASPAPTPPPASFRLTGDKAYEKQFAADTADVSADHAPDGDARYGPCSTPWAAARCSPTRPCATASGRPCSHTADQIAIDDARQARPALGRQLLHADAGRPADHAPGARGRRRLRPDQAERPGQGPAATWPRSTPPATTSSAATPEHDLGDRPGPAPPEPGLPHGRLVQRQGHAPPGHHPLRPLAQGQGPGARARGTPTGRTRPSIRSSTTGRATSAGSTTAARP